MHGMGAVNNSGWAKLTKVEAHVVLIRDAAAQGDLVKVVVHGYSMDLVRKYETTL